MSEASTLEKLASREYKYGFVTDIESETVPPGLDESVVRLISHKKNEPEWLLAWRLKSLNRFLEMLEDEVAAEIGGGKEVETETESDVSGKISEGHKKLKELMEEDGK